MLALNSGTIVQAGVGTDTCYSILQLSLTQCVQKVARECQPLALASRKALCD